MTQHLLDVRDLSVSFRSPTGPVHAVRHLSLHLDRGETLAVLGESGSGKSVSAATIMNLIDCPPAQIESGAILFSGRDLATMPEEERRQINGRRIAMIFQDPLAHLNPVYSVGWQIAEAQRVHGTAASAARDRALDLLHRVGIKSAAERYDDYPHQFSGGQRQRVMVAMALAASPDILIADEPTTALDVTIQAQILDLLKELQAETGMGLLLISHDLGVVAKVADRVLVMNGGEVVESGPTRDIYARPQHWYTAKLVGAASGRYRNVGAGNQVSASPILTIEHVSKYYGTVQALDDINLEVKKGETVAIVGESGSGKSTLARTILRLEEASGGQVHYDGRDILKLSGREMLAVRRDVQMVFQDPSQSLNPRMKVEHIIAEPWIIHADIVPKAERKERVAALLDMVGLRPDHMARYPHQFSGGQKQRIAIARALAVEPRLIVCDEAVSALDVSVQAQIMTLLDKLRGELGLSYLFITHDLGLVRDFADRAVVMRAGKVIEQGLTHQIFASPVDPYTRSLIEAILPIPAMESRVAQ